MDNEILNLMRGMLPKVNTEPIEPDDYDSNLEANIDIASIEAIMKEEQEGFNENNSELGDTYTKRFCALVDKHQGEFNINRVTLYGLLIGIGDGLQNGKSAQEDGLPVNLARTIDFNSILNKVGSFSKLKITPTMLDIILPGLSEQSATDSLFEKIPSLDRIEIKQGSVHKLYTRVAYLDRIQTETQLQDETNGNIIRFEQKAVEQTDKDKMFDTTVVPQLENEVQQVDKSKVDPKAINFVDPTTNQQGMQYRQAFSQAPETAQQATQKIMYAKDCYTDEKGNSVSFTNVLDPVDWDKDIIQEDSPDSVQTNFEKLSVQFTEAFINKLGGFDKLNTVVVFNDNIIINNVRYQPALKDINKYLDYFPMSLIGHLQQGSFAPLFDWSYIKYCRNIRKLSFDSLEYVCDYVGPALGIYQIKPAYFFNTFRNLDYLKIGDYESDKEEEKYIPKTVKEQRERTFEAEEGFFSRAASYYQKSHFDYSRLAPTRLTDKIDNHFCGCLKDYVKNRGKKGLFRFAGGCVVRAFFAGAATLLNAGTHLVGDTVGYLSQYGPHVEKCQDRTGFTCYVGYKPNKRTQGDALGFTSGATVVGDRPISRMNEDLSKPKAKKSSKKKDDTPQVEFDDGE